MNFLVSKEVLAVAFNVPYSGCLNLLCELSFFKDDFFSFLGSTC